MTTVKCLLLVTRYVQISNISKSPPKMKIKIGL